MDRLQPQERADDIDLKQTLKLLSAGILNAVEGDDTGIIDQDVDPPEDGERLGNDCGPADLVGYVMPPEPRAQTDFGGDGGTLILQYVRDHDRGAGLCQGAGVGGALAARAAGNDCDFFGDVSHFIFPAAGRVIVP